MPVLDAELPGTARGLFTTRPVDLAVRGDDPDAARAHRAALPLTVGRPGATVTIAAQVHGAEVVVLARDRAPDPAELDIALAGADALVSNDPTRALATLAADCMPVLLADPVAGVVAAAHAGRPGLVAGVLAATVAAMRTLGAEPARTVAVIGPCIGGCCYELPADLVASVEAAVPGTAAHTRWGTPSIDLRSGAHTQLAAAGLTTVRDVGGCTHEQPELFYSYRRDGTASRHAGVVVAG